MPPLRSSPILAGAALLLIVACDSPQSSSPGEPTVAGVQQRDDRIVMAASGARLRVDVVQQVLTRYTRHVALALRRPALRAQVYAALHSSPYPEHKLHFSRFLKGNGKPVLKGLSEVTGRSETAALAGLDSIFPLEFYMPVKEHFARWDGGEDLIVVSQIQDHDTPVGFDLKGNPVPVSSQVMPSKPTLVLVNVETDFDATDRASALRAPIHEDATCGDSCQPPCIGDACGGTGGTPSGSGIPLGIYMTYLSLVDDGEDNFFRGDPEIEVMLIARTARSGPNRVELADYPANESTSAPYRRFNHNGTLWTAPTGTPGVLVASEVVLRRIRDLYPGVAPDSIPYNVTVWEDDFDRGVIYDPDNRWQDEVFTTSLMIPGLQINFFGGRPDPWAGVLFVVGLLNLLDEDFSGSQDDFLGTHVDRDDYRRRTGVLVPRTHVLMKGRSKMGEMNLIYR